MDARERHRLLQDGGALRLRRLERRLAVRDPVRVAGEHVGDLRLVRPASARGAQRDQERLRLHAVRVVRGVDDLLRRHEAEEAEQVDRAPDGGVEEDARLAREVAGEPGEVGDAGVRDDQRRLRVLVDERVRGRRRSAAARGRRGSGSARAARRRSRRPVSSRSSFSRNFCARGCSLIPRAPRSRQRFASSIGLVGQVEAHKWDQPARSPRSANASVRSLPARKPARGRARRGRRRSRARRRSGRGPRSARRGGLPCRRCRCRGGYARRRCPRPTAAPGAARPRRRRRAPGRAPARSRIESTRVGYSNAGASTRSRKTRSGTAPSHCGTPLTTMRGTAQTSRESASAGNSVASTAAARMRGRRERRSVRQQHGRRAMRSGRRDEDVDREIAVETRRGARATRPRATTCACRPRGRRRGAMRARSPREARNSGCRRPSLREGQGLPGTARRPVARPRPGRTPSRKGRRAPRQSVRSPRRSRCRARRAAASPPGRARRGAPRAARARRGARAPSALRRAGRSSRR